MAEVMLSAFKSGEDANKAVGELEDAGFKTKDISVILQHNLAARAINPETQGERFAARLGRGVVEGGAVGGLIGLLAGALGLVVLGPIAALFGIAGVAGMVASGAVIGASAGGLIEVLVSWGISRQTAETYEQTVHGGGILVAVPLGENNESDVRKILEENNGQDLTTIQVDESKFGKTYK